MSETKNIEYQGFHPEIETEDKLTERLNGLFKSEFNVDIKKEDGEYFTITLKPTDIKLKYDPTADSGSRVTIPNIDFSSGSLEKFEQEERQIMKVIDTITNELQK